MFQTISPNPGSLTRQKWYKYFVTKFIYPITDDTLRKVTSKIHTRLLTPASFSDWKWSEIWTEIQVVSYHRKRINIVFIWLWWSKFVFYLSSLCILTYMWNQLYMHYVTRIVERKIILGIKSEICYTNFVFSFKVIIMSC